MAAGMSQAEREAARQRYRDAALAQADRANMSLRCQRLQYDLKHQDHQFCRGEDRGNSGCLCRCHDNPGAVVISRHDERAG